MDFGWDSAKAEDNRRKHGLSFDEAAELFRGDANYLEIFDREHSDDEERFIAIGPVGVGVIVVAYTERVRDTIRLISARLATTREARLFHEHIKRYE